MKEKEKKEKTEKREDGTPCCYEGEECSPITTPDTMTEKEVATWRLRRQRRPCRKQWYRCRRWRRRPSLSHETQPVPILQRFKQISLNQQKNENFDWVKEQLINGCKRICRQMRWEDVEVNGWKKRILRNKVMAHQPFNLTVVAVVIAAASSSLSVFLRQSHGPPLSLWHSSHPSFSLFFFLDRFFFFFFNDKFSLSLLCLLGVMFWLVVIKSHFLVLWPSKHFS